MKALKKFSLMYDPRQKMSDQTCRVRLGICMEWTIGVMPSLECQKRAKGIIWPTYSTCEKRKMIVFLCVNENQK